MGLKILPVSEHIKKITNSGLIINGNGDLSNARRMDISGNLGEGQFVCLMQKTQNLMILEQKANKKRRRFARRRFFTYN